MKRDTDFFANPNVFLLILAICALFQSIIFFAVGLQLYTLPSFFNWVLATSLVSITASLLILKYYRYKQYTSAFIFGIIALMAGVFHAVVFFTIRLLQT